MRPRFVALALALLIALPASGQDSAPDPRAEAARANARLAIEYLKREQLAVAREKIDKALRQNPGDAIVQMSAGVVFERLHETERAEKHFRLALRADTDSPEAQNALGAFLCRSREFARGEAMFLKAARNPLYQTPEVAYTNAGVCARNAGNLERAEEYLREALKVRVVYPETFLQLAGVLHERGSYLQARAFVERFLAAAPATADVLMLGHQIERALNDRDAAEAFAERLRREFPGSAQARALDDIQNRTSE